MKHPHFCVFPPHFCNYRKAAIHQEAPEFVEMNVAQEILVTGIKVVDLLAPYAKGGKIGKLWFRQPEQKTLSLLSLQRGIILYPGCTVFKPSE